ncbi:MAG: SDR family NAD(P)-dependent oxidoreductase [Deltaproteobacteria bacterium]|nr:SDR family NAD(P)-dependent oxidoreductase [Deltaproteobacteria bacterium]
MGKGAEASFGAETTTSEVIDGIDLSGRLALVTGASGGLGAETARALASVGAEVVLAVRNVAKGEGVAESIRASVDGAHIEVRELELSVPASVRAFAKGFLAEHPSLNILINNAGVMACPLERTAEGWEMQFATCHLGHFLLTCLLAPALRAGAPARVVNLSSGGHRFSPVLFDDIHFESTEYDKWVAYGQAKTANVLFTCELERRMQDSGVHALAVHPGVILTELARHLDENDIKQLMEKAPKGEGLKFKPVEAGAATSTWAATAPSLEGRGALYLEDCHIGELDEAEDSAGGYRGYAVDPAAAARLWELSEEMLGERFDLG